MKYPKKVWFNLDEIVSEIITLDLSFFKEKVKSTLSIFNPNDCVITKQSLENVIVRINPKFPKETFDQSFDKYCRKDNQCDFHGVLDIVKETLC